MQKADLGVDGDEAIAIELDAQLQRKRQRPMHGTKGPHQVLGQRRRRGAHERAAGADAKQRLFQDGPQQIVIVGPRDSAETATLWTAANKKYRPFAVITRVDPGDQAAIAAHMPWIAGMKMIDGKATVYVSRGFACDAPSTDPAVLT